MASRCVLNAVAGTIAYLIQGCQPEPQEPAVFDFVVGCFDSDWEACRRKQNSLDTASIESFQKMLDSTFDDAYPFSALYSTTTRDQFELLIVRDPHTAFLFQSTISDRGGKRIRVIRTSSETFATITKLAIARHFHELEGFDEEWLAHYLLYIRKTPDGQPIVDPLRASGLISTPGGQLEVAPGAPDFTQAIRSGINDTSTVITYMVAHELYHLERPFECNEPKPVCEVRKRADEAAADRFAIDILRKLSAEDPTPDHRLGVPAYVFSQLMLTLEGAKGRSPIAPGSHPPHHERLRVAVQTLEGWISENASSPSADSLRELVDSALTILRRIDQEGPQKYFAGLDEEASAVTLSSLKVY